MNNIKRTTIHPFGPSTPVRGLPPLPGPTLGTPPSGAWPGCQPSFPSRTPPPASHHPNLSPPPNLNPNIPPPNLHPPARPNMPSIICPTYPPLTIPALPSISLLPVRPTRTTPNVAYPLSLRIETPPTSLTLQPPPLFIHPVQCASSSHA